MSGRHCETCTCPPEVQVGTYCFAETVRGHETFGCLEWKDHAPPHRGQLVSPPCPVCGGLDAHAEGCREIGNDPLDPALLEVRWLDGQPLTLAPVGDP